GVLVGRLVEDEVLLLAVGGPAHFVEQSLLKAGALDGLQKVLGDDHVGIDIDHRQRCGDAAQRREFIHGSLAKGGINGLSRPPSSSPRGLAQRTLMTRVLAIMSCRPRFLSVKAIMRKPMPRMSADTILAK